MTDRDITFLLADAAEEVQIGAPPFEALVRGGRGRRARRWTVAAATALVVTASTGATLAWTGLPGGGGDRGGAVAARPPTAERHQVLAPRRTLLATGTDRGREWSVTIDVWAAPRTEREAQAQLNAMGARERLMHVRPASQLVGKISYFVRRTVVGGAPLVLFDNTVDERLREMAIPPTVSVIMVHGSLVFGQVVKGVEQVTCTWSDGTTTQVRRQPPGHDLVGGEGVIRAVDGWPEDWFLCAAPNGTTLKSAKATH